MIEIKTLHGREAVLALCPDAPEDCDCMAAVVEYPVTTAAFFRKDGDTLVLLGYRPDPVEYGLLDGLLRAGIFAAERQGLAHCAIAPGVSLPEDLFPTAYGPLARGKLTMDEFFSK